MSRKKYQPRNEFRKHKRSGHPAYIFAKVDDEFLFLGITHADVTRGIKNIQLDSNPDSKDNMPAYIKNVVEHDKSNQFSEPHKGWIFSEEDKEKVNKVIRGRKTKNNKS